MSNRVLRPRLCGLGSPRSPPPSRHRPRPDRASRAPAGHAGVHRFVPRARRGLRNGRPRGAGSSTRVPGSPGVRMRRGRVRARSPGLDARQALRASRAAAGVRAPRNARDGRGRHGPAHGARAGRRGWKTAPAARAAPRSRPGTGAGSLRRVVASGRTTAAADARAASPASGRRCREPPARAAPRQ